MEWGEAEYSRDRHGDLRFHSGGIGRISDLQHQAHRHQQCAGAAEGVDQRPGQQRGGGRKPNTAEPGSCDGLESVEQ
eukprot:scaffold407899_cov33-Prasinocladus_malaysianus.AAC.2